ncbi:hypothetical protein B0H63DRAFT_453344 [Podospora didyma]|uniref:DNA/RNA-binding domain-containing protein n=1 Tax=Podospora didyma TaxID=330526 RepID=A0AAE0K8B1_9PEZI|nr:hypothetical protein B0H63DRAFT_453344 [Podospora didyma]
MDFNKSWIKHLRTQTRKQPPFVCPLCRNELQSGLDIEAFKEHVAASHPKELGEQLPEKAQAWIQSLWNGAPPEREGSSKPSGATSEVNPRSRRVTAAGDVNPQAHSRPANRKKPAPELGRGTTATTPAPSTQVPPEQESDSSGRSPASSLKREGSRSTSPPKKSMPRPASHPVADVNPAEFKRAPPQKEGRLWNPDDEPPPVRPTSYDKNNVATNHRLRVASGTHPNRSRGQGPSQVQGQVRTQNQVEEDEPQLPTELIKQPETRPISQEQLVAEVKGIYAGLVMVESKCIEVDNAQNAQQQESGDKELHNDQWQALIALHRTLLHEHHDFFLASQHPSASPALRRLASKYAMPARMWRHGIHTFLELLRHKLPLSLEHMLTFIYVAYSMMALLYETVPTFEDTWIECLGDLGRYRMAIEDDNIRDRETWTSVSRHWYSKASDKAPATGRLYHHLAILARPNALQQLFYYAKSMCVAMPFSSARESIMTLFDPIIVSATSQQSRLGPSDHAFVKAHGIMFSGKEQESLAGAMADFLGGLDNHIARMTRKWLEPGYHIALANFCAIIGYGSESNPITSVIKQPISAESRDHQMTGDESGHNVPLELANALRLANKTHNVVFRRFGDPNILPYFHVTLVFMYHLTFYPEAMAYAAPEFPWKLAALMLNTLLDTCQSYPRIESEVFPHSEDAQRRPLPEDYAMRGLLWTDKYFPDTWFSNDNDKIDDDEKYFEVASMSEDRKERALFLGCRIAAKGRGNWLRYDGSSRQFSANPQYDIELEVVPVAPAVDSTELGELPDAADR